jgi:hypothetical protein
MKTATENRKWFEQLLAQDHPVETDVAQSWLQRRRENARNEIQQLPLPTPKTESWKYNLLVGLFSHRFTPVTEDIQALQM